MMMRYSHHLSTCTCRLHTDVFLRCFQFILEEVDITRPENKDWYDLYRYDIPVFHMYEDFVCKHRVDMTAFEHALEKYKHGFTK